MSGNNATLRLKTGSVSEKREGCRPTGAGAFPISLAVPISTGILGGIPAFRNWGVHFFSSSRGLGRGKRRRHVVWVHDGKIRNLKYSGRGTVQNTTSGCTMLRVSLLVLSKCGHRTSVHLYTQRHIRGPKEAPRVDAWPYILFKRVSSSVFVGLLCCARN